MYDHFYGFAEHSDSWLEGWTTLTWLAARFPTVQIGPLVLGVGYRNPALVAKMAATLQVLSGGRLVLGLGAGWREEEYRAVLLPHVVGSLASLAPSSRSLLAPLFRASLASSSGEGPLVCFIQSQYQKPYEGS